MEPTDPVTLRAQARVGTLLNGRWHLDKLVGVGGMAAVYAATHRNTKRVAIKILHAEISVDENARQRFLMEGYAANQVGHRGAVAADDDGLTEDGVAFLVMELLEGETLEERGIRKGGKLEEREVLALMDQALSTLEAAHERNIVHRDIKPENLFLTRDGALKVLDFGIARLQLGSGSPSQTQGVMGTPSFMAPEQARGRWEEVDGRTDLWAIGATMFTLLSGRFVHQAETINETLVLAVTERAPSLSKVSPSVHPALAELVDKSLMYERELRFQSASEFRAAVKAAYATLTGDESMPGLAVPSSSRLLVAEPSFSVTLDESVRTERGVTTSMASVPSDPQALAGRRRKSTLLVLGLASVAVFGVILGRGLGGEAKRTAYPEPKSIVVAAGAELPVKAETSALAALPGASDPALLLPAVEPASKAAHPAVVRSASHAGAQASVTKKPATSKLTVDPFLKRH
ncbi:MAG TPA: serine/threonine-protein kinase [Polyangiaceae bacterium]|jgi:serine/threonine-protein kinase|nr:serine/threonine-protein kinase [Polyangiaceae bacterium]